ncbi:MAG: hypothetical protein AAGG51_00445 [Cyanobacteria bacterium P01_G01_bin.54]
MLKRLKSLQYFFLPLLLFTPTQVLATYQIRDVLTVDEERHDIENVPLEARFSREFIWERVAPRTICSGNWRGYQAFWEIIEGDLYVVSVIRDACSPGEIVSAKDLFSEENYPVRADWYSGEIFSWTGRSWHDEVVQPDGSVDTTNYRYERIVFAIEEGMLKESYVEVVDGEERVRLPGL